METVLSMIAFFALIASWFVLPASPRRAHAKVMTRPAAEAMLPAA